jgi:hypothetical protein
VAANPWRRLLLAEGIVSSLFEPLVQVATVFAAVMAFLMMFSWVAKEEASSVANLAVLLEVAGFASRPVELVIFPACSCYLLHFLTP